MIVQLHRLIDLRHYYEAMHKLHYTSVGPLERGPADGMGPLIRLGIKLLFIYSVDKMLPRLIVVGEGNIADCCHWWWLLCRPLYSAGDEYHYTPPSWCPGPSLTSASKSSIRRFVIMEKAPTRAFSWLKAATTAFTFKTLLRHYAKWTLTPRSLNVKLGTWRNYHKGRVG